MRLLCIGILSSLFILFSCNKDEGINANLDFGTDYFPGTKGTYVIYQCDSTVYPDLNSAVRNYKFQIKEIIDSNFTDNTGQNAIRISRFKKWEKYDTLNSIDSTWHLQDVWWGNVKNNKVEIVEENNRVVKLIFPVEEGKTWKGNVYNNLGDWDFEYESFDTPFSNGNLNFPKTTKVKQYNSGNILIYYKKYEERYARGVGMIQKEIEDYTWDNLNGTILVGTIKFGIHYTMNAIQFGKQ